MSGKKFRMVDPEILIEIYDWVSRITTAYRFARILARFGVNRWKRLSGPKQYLILGIPFLIGIFSPVVASTIIAFYFYFPLSIPVLVAGVAIFYSFFSPSNVHARGRRFMHHYLEARYLWRDSRTRTCKGCGHYDYRTRNVTKPESEIYESAFAPCERCGATNFELHQVDYRPTVQEMWS